MEKFSYETNGYNRSEVNQFVGDVIRETEGIISRVKKQNAELETLRKELQTYKEMVNTLNSSITKQKETEAQMKMKADDIINSAKSNASRIVNEALLKAEKIELQKDLLERNMRIFKKKLKSIMEQQQAVVDEIEILEMEEN